MRGMHGMSGMPGGGWGGAWGGHGGSGGHRGRPGPPPWLGEMLGFTRPEPPRPPRARKGDVRAAILDVLAAEPMNGYQLIQQIAERSGGAWRPSPGSVYPTVQQLEDEGLVEGDQAAGRRTLRLTAEGESYVADHPEELAAVWEPFLDTPASGRGGGGDFASFMPEVGQTLSAVWQIVSSGTEEQRRQAVAIMTDARRRLYQVLADGDPAEAPDGATDGTGDEGPRGELR
ncbi:hypothetical protein GCM10009737_04730 [Nocardioides lentus]|uniref:Transcription regulator PadR N-terminal domain-containing protein n=1 Tax=Nocardioides lentus TaxID=338077 RepID=A0ABN2P0J3_9ACTN